MPVPTKYKLEDLRIVLEKIEGGMRYKEIAEELGLTRKQIKDRAARLKSLGYSFQPKRAELPKDGKKKCIRCLSVKELAEFYERGDHGSSWCKECAKIRTKANLYGISEEDLASLRLNLWCPLCVHPYSEKRVACVDHDHSTGKVRGVICLFCNHALGRIFDDAETALRIHEYLKHHQGGGKCQ